MMAETLRPMAADSVSLPPGVEGIGERVSSKDVDVYRLLRETQDRSRAVAIRLESETSANRSNLRLRNVYAIFLLAAMLVEAVVANVAFYLIGAGIIEVDRWVGSSFILGVFGQITTLTTVVVRYLFADKSTAERHYGSP